MFKTDDASLEKISFEFTGVDIARFKRLLELLTTQGLGTLPMDEINRLSIGLEKIGALKLTGKIYGFHASDSYAANQSSDAGEGVELYIRQGNALNEYIVSENRNYVLKVDDVFPILQRNSIATVYTGTIPLKGTFLTLPQESDPESPLWRSALPSYEINIFEARGINVVTLESLL